MGFREVANTLPTTPAVLEWVSRCLAAQPGRRENRLFSPNPPAAQMAATRTTTDNNASVLSPSPEDVEGTLPLKRSRSPSGARTSPLRSIGPDPGGPSTLKRTRTSSPTPDLNASRRRSRELLSALIKGLGLDKIRAALCWASQQWPEDPALRDRELNLTMPESRHDTITAAARWRELLLNAALSHEPLQKRVIGEAPTKLIMASVPNGDFADMCDHFATRIAYLERERFPRSNKELTRAAANSLGHSVSEMLCAMSQPLPRLETSDAKVACLRSTTDILSTVLARCNDSDPMEVALKWSHATGWSGSIRSIMEMMTDDELTRLRNSSYIDSLLSVRESLSIFRRREAAEARWREWEQQQEQQEQQEQEEQERRLQQRQELERFTQREAHPDYRPRPSPPLQPPPPRPPLRIMWPNFEAKTMIYFAERTGGWDAAWDSWQPEGSAP